MDSLFSQTWQNSVTRSMIFGILMMKGDLPGMILKLGLIGPKLEEYILEMRQPKVIPAGWYKTDVK